MLIETSLKLSYNLMNRYVAILTLLTNAWIFGEARISGPYPPYTSAGEKWITERITIKGIERNFIGLVVTDRCMGFECSATEITTQLRQCVTYLRRLIVIANYVYWIKRCVQLYYFSNMLLVYLMVTGLNDES